MPNVLVELTNSSGNVTVSHLNSGSKSKESWLIQMWANHQLLFFFPGSSFHLELLGRLFFPAGRLLGAWIFTSPINQSEFPTYVQPASSQIDVQLTSGQDKNELPIQTATRQLIFLILKTFDWIYACVCKCVCLRGTHIHRGSQRTICGSQFFLSVMWIPRIELRLDNKAPLSPEPS